MKAWAALVLCACSNASARAPEASPPPSKPAGCVPVAAGASLQAAIDAAPERGALCLAPGTYAGPIALARGVTVWGPRDAVIASPGTGTTVRMTGEGPALLGVTVSGSGTRYDLLDAAVYVNEAEGARVDGVRIEKATFGILVDKSRHVTVARCTVEGDAKAALGMRGDAIRFWETNDSYLEDNRVHAGRDVVVWYSSRNVVAKNVVDGGRYGTHLMYSHDNRVSDNRYLGNEVGVFVMYSRNVVIEDNWLAGSTGAAGMGLGLKESGNVTVSRNRAVHDTVGFYLDTSPLREGDTNVFEANELALDDVAITFHASPRANTFRANVLRDNRAHVQVDGGGDAQGVLWDANTWGDYAGYDLDGDRVGDVPYEERSLSAELTDKRPELAFFRGSATLGLVELAGKVVPILAPKKVLVDQHPRMP
jgi:nitrous oxidase accessory protein